MMENMPPGFRFYPTEEELVTFYLRKKLEDNRDDGLNQLMDRVIPVVNIYDYNPHQLPQLFLEILCHKDTEQWFFFVPRQESEARGGRPNRLTATGYWKATGSPGHVFASNRPVGEKKTMVFYVGKAPHGRKTEWKMNEYKAIDGEASTSNGANSTLVLRQEMSLCRIYKKSKCLRAFDRRPLPHEEGGMTSQPPPPLPISSAPAAAHHQPPNYYVDHHRRRHHHHNMTNIDPSAGDYAHHHQMEPGVPASSPESSSSGDHPHHGHHYHQQNMESTMILDDDPWNNLLDLFYKMP